MYEALETLWQSYMEARSELRRAWVRGEITREQYHSVAEAFFAFTTAKETIIRRESGNAA
jgi:hypothetical protein